MFRTRTARPAARAASELDIVAALEREWEGLARGPVTRSLRLWAEREPALAAFATGEQLLGSLRRLRGRHAEENAILAALLRAAPSDPLAGRVVLHALLPGLKRLAGRLLLEVGERETLWSLLLAHAWEQIRAYPLERRPRRIAANLLLDTAHATLAELSAERRQRAGAAELEAAAPGSVEPADQVEVVLARAVRAGALSREEAVLILETRIEGRPLASLAATSDVSYEALKKRRRRAERRLLLFLGHPDVPFRGRNRPLSRARAAGTGLAGSAGGGAVTHLHERR